jgi:HK97 family phage major capsid protein
MLQALREQRAAKAKELHELVNNKDEKWTDDKQKIYDEGMAEIDELDGKIKRINDVNTRVAEDALKNGIIDAAERVGRDQKSEACKLFAKWLRVGQDGLSAEEQRAIRNTMSTTTNWKGGYTVPTRSPRKCSTRSRPSAGCVPWRRSFRHRAGNDQLSDLGWNRGDRRAARAERDRRCR